MSDVAQRAGVSISTVSRVINQSMAVSIDLRRQVLEAVDALNYEPIRVGSTTGEGKLASIAVIVTSLRSPFFSNIIAGIQSVSFDHGYTTVVFDSDNDQEKEIIHVNELPYHSGIEGVIFAGIWAWDHQDHIVELSKRGIPISLINRRVPNLALDMLQVDQSLGTFEATSHLLELGHRRIGIIFNRANAGVPPPDQLAGVRRAHEQFGLEMDEDLMVETDFSPQGGYKAALTLLNRAERPSAIFARADRLALGVLRAAHELSIAIPDALSVVGYGDEPDSKFWSPALTTVRQPQYEMGTRAAELLFERIADSSLPQRQIIFQPRLIERESAAAYRDPLTLAANQESLHG